MIPKSSLCASRYEKNPLGSGMKTSFTSEMDRKNTKLTKAFQKTQIQVKNQILDDLLQVYSWRSKTELPVAKVMFYKVIDRNPNQTTTTIEISYESFPLTLSDLSEISVSNVLYLLREAAVGFQKLFGVFGSFLISYKMIGINKNNRCKVWINENFAVNQPIDVQMFKSLNQKAFMSQIIDLFKKKTQRSKKTEMIFTELGQCPTFQLFVQCIETFSKKNAIQISTCYRVDEKDDRKNQVSKSPIRNPNQLTTNSFIADKSKQFPKFLNKSIINDPNKSIIGASMINQRIEKSRSITKSGIRNRTPLNNNRSQVNLNSTYRPNTKTPVKFQRKEADGDKAQKMDYSFEKKNKSSSPLENKKPRPMIESTNSLTQQDTQVSLEGRSFLQYNKKMFQLNEVMKSDLNTTHTNSSGITNVSPRRLLQKKNSIFDVEQNMLESIVIGNEHDRPKVNLFSTADLQHLGKLGKTVIESCMPEDFVN